MPCKGQGQTRESVLGQGQGPGQVLQAGSWDERTKPAAALRVPCCQGLEGKWLAWPWCFCRGQGGAKASLCKPGSSLGMEVEPRSETH